MGTETPEEQSDSGPKRLPAPHSESGLPLDSSFGSEKRQGTGRGGRSPSESNQGLTADMSVSDGKEISVIKMDYDTLLV